ncbi:DUF4974 domain-containing protein [Chitinophaga horti]|uniref:DUF4974 domain-containing protein n=1 Tax=Chitinophaga horti TaxID=2920382 RepID=A0ABY6IYP4_9BACT|nr:FecR domain-containing protein [Chitinophaga horti]UYQ92513.1 DUF4974 domain-containing protein [Chitinophaga horti]
MTAPQRIQQLAQKFLEGTATEAEQAELHAWYDQVPQDEIIPGDGDQLHRTMKQRVDWRIKSRRPMWLRMGAAAAITGLIAAGAYFWQRSETPVLAGIEERYQYDVKPGGNKATLTLGDGSIVELDTLQNGTLGNQAGTRIVKIAGAQLAYNSEEETGIPKPVLYNTITTPRGGQYQVILPDGSNVWLNASSSLRFPTAFAGAERSVELTGEGYFEVAQKAGQPFLVKVNGLEVQVLGTSFNVSAYHEEVFKTSLLKGAIKVRNGEAITSVIKPGQQVKLSGQQLQVSVDRFIEDAAAWKDGMFVFNEEPLEGIMRQLGRWYNVEVVFTSDILKRKVLTGQIARSEQLSEVLKMLELTEAVHFRISPSTITVER